MDQYFFEMTALGWTYHSRPRYSDDEEQRRRIDRRFIGVFGGTGSIICLDTLPAVCLFLAYYQDNVGLHDYEYPSLCLCQHILAVMGLMPPDTFGLCTRW